MRSRWRVASTNCIPELTSDACCVMFSISFSNIVSRYLSTTSSLSKTSAAMSAFRKISAPRLLLTMARHRNQVIDQRVVQHGFGERCSGGHSILLVNPAESYTTPDTRKYGGHSLRRIESEMNERQ